VRRWLDDIEEGLHPSDDFAMSAEQLRRYRQVGTYGAYRVVLRSVPGLTTGDGWTPDATGLQLAELVNESLPRGARLAPTDFEYATKWGHWLDNEARYWLKHGWANAWTATGGMLPTADDAIQKQLSADERELLAPALFGPNSVRRATAQVLAGATGARSHSELCDALAESTRLANKLEPASIAALPAFSRLADAAMDAMRCLWGEINGDANHQTPAVEKVVRSKELQWKLDLLREASDAWLKAKKRNTFPHEQVTSELAEAMRDAASRVDQLRALAKHHYERGGGRRWFREQAGKLVPLVADTGIAASDYRFRLRALCLLAAQCGVANMTSAIDAISQQRDEDEDGDTL